MFNQSNSGEFYTKLVNGEEDWTFSNCFTIKRWCFSLTTMKHMETLIRIFLNFFSHSSGFLIFVCHALCMQTDWNIVETIETKCSCQDCHILFVYLFWVFNVDVFLSKRARENLNIGITPIPHIIHHFCNTCLMPVSFSAPVRK